MKHFRRCIFFALLIAVAFAVQLKLSGAGNEEGASVEEAAGTSQMEAVAPEPSEDEEETVVLPEKYDLREVGKVSKIYDQGSYGTCWAFAAIAALESSLLPEESWNFSVDHMTMSNSFNANQYDGGEYTMGMAYLSAWQGPVNEEDDPYGDGVTNASLRAVKHVQEIQVIDEKDIDEIKKAVYMYGGVETSLYSTIKSSEETSDYYNNETYAYCYTGTESPNHDVVIIGWDDTFSADEFKTKPEGDGAFICQNSWSEEFGDDGFFYVSYYDGNIGTHNVAYTRVDDVDNYDHIYQSDLCGWVGKIGYDKEEIYGANVYEAKSAESVCAAGFYATGKNTSYRIYIVKDFENEESFDNRVEVAEGTVPRMGYYTIDFEEPVDVEVGERYAVVIYLNTPDSTHPLAIEYDTGDPLLSNVDTDDGEGYISLNGNNFVNVKKKRECNLCIKAFTKDR